MHAETAPVPFITEDEQRPGIATRLMTAAWRVATSNVLLLTVAVVTLGMVLLALLLPQMPNNLQSNPAAATRWLMGVAADLGSPGAPLRTLGVFNLLHSPIFVLALMLLIFLLAVHLAREIGLALALRQIRTVFHTPVSSREPLALPPMLDLFRRRVAIPETAISVASEVEQTLTAHHGHVARETLVMATDAASDDNPDPEPELNEIRLLAARHLRLAWLRPVMVGGLLLAVITLWLNSAFGWEVIPNTLAPGGNYRYPPRGLELTYLLDEASDALAAGLQVRLGATDLIVPIEPEAQHAIGRALLLARAQSPGLVIQTEPPGVQMGVPGEPASASALGFSFPEAGSEQSLIFPEASIGVRLVRLAPDASERNPYMIELYQASQATAAQREMVDMTEERLIEVDDAAFKLKLTPAPAVDALVRYQPLAWLTWVGLALALLGLPGFLLRPIFALGQIAPLDDGRTQLIIQSNQLDAVEMTVAHTAEATTTSTQEEDAGEHP